MTASDHDEDCLDRAASLLRRWHPRRIPRDHRGRIAGIALLHEHDAAIIEIHHTGGPALSRSLRAFFSKHLDVKVRTRRVRECEICLQHQRGGAVTGLQQGSIAAAVQRKSTPADGYSYALTAFHVGGPVGTQVNAGACSGAVVRTPDVYQNSAYSEAALLRLDDAGTPWPGGANASVRQDLPVRLETARHGRRSGTVRYVAYDVPNVAMGVGNVMLRRQIVIKGTAGQGFSSAGDSGGMVEDENGRAIGIVVGAYNGLTIVSPITAVLVDLKCSL